MATILIVDDEPPIAEFLSELLEDEGHRVLLANHGRKALERIASEPPDLVISDLMMPVMDGGQLCITLRKNPRTAAIPIIMISAAGDRWTAVGADANITKPIDVASFLTTVAQLLARV
jgi:two-component system phosphate regulon response regulator PhoB